MATPDNEYNAYIFTCTFPICTGCVSLQQNKTLTPHVCIGMYVMYNIMLVSKYSAYSTFPIYTCGMQFYKANNNT